jgi:anti-anti-sigma factor
MQARHAMKLSLQSEEEGILRLQNEGEIRLSDQLRERSSVEDVLGVDCYSRKILLDLRNTSYIDSAGVGWLVKFHKLCQQFGGVLVLHSLPPAIMAILRLLHMERFLYIVDDERAAYSLVKGEAP